MNRSHHPPEPPQRRPHPPRPRPPLSAIAFAAMAAGIASSARWRAALCRSLEEIAALLRFDPPRLATAAAATRICRLPAASLTADEIRGHAPPPRRSVPSAPADPAGPPPPAAAAPPREPVPRSKRRRGRMAPSGGAALMAAALAMPWTPLPFGVSPAQADAVVVAALDAALERSGLPPLLREAFRGEIAAALTAVPDLGEDKRRHAEAAFGHWLGHHRDRFAAAASSGAARDEARQLLRRHVQSLRDAVPLDEASRRALLAEETLLLETLLDGGQRLLPRLEEPLRQRLRQRLVAASEERSRRRSSYFFPEWSAPAATDPAAIRERVLAQARDDLMLRSMAARADADAVLLETEPETARFRRAMLEMAIDLLADRLAAIAGEILPPIGAGDERFSPPPAFTSLDADAAKATDAAAPTLAELLASLESRRPAGSGCGSLTLAATSASASRGDGGPP